jgi:two-component sensor histidine kinase
MDSQIQQIAELTSGDVALLQRIERTLPITADISRADVWVCCRLAASKALVVAHAMPQSTPSLYRQSAAGRTLAEAEHALIFRALTSGSGGRRQREVLQSGAPVFQDVYPLHNGTGRVIAALVVETNMIAHERHRRRNQHFRRAVRWLQEMSVLGELAGVEKLGRFGQYDGIYQVNRNRTIVYMSGIASNLFRTIGVVIDAVGEQISILESADVELVERAFETRSCLEARHEYTDGRVWERKVVPLRASSSGWLPHWLARPWYGAPRSSKSETVDAVLVMVHNATEAVQKQRELNVKSAIIQEVHHRVKNNLQNIAAILRMQARRSKSEEAKQHLVDAVNRVLSMSVIHEFLSQDEHRAINLRDVCQRIANQVIQVANNPEKEALVQVHGPNIYLPTSQATPAAMVVNELLLNAVEHGLAERNRGRIDVRLQDLGNAVELVIEDDGNGLPPNFKPEQSTSLGLQIVHTLVTDDLKGTLQMESIYPATRDPSVSGSETLPAALGTRAIVTFPKKPLGVD